MKDYGVTIWYTITNISGVSSSDSIFVRRKADSPGNALSSVVAIFNSMNNAKDAEGNPQIKVGQATVVEWTTPNTGNGE